MGSSRAMLHVAMTPGGQNDEEFLTKVKPRSDHEHAKPVSGDAIHQVR
jgi:hypothetical protein